MPQIDSKDLFPTRLFHAMSRFGTTRVPLQGMTLRLQPNLLRRRENVEPYLKEGACHCDAIKKMAGFQSRLTNLVWKRGFGPALFLGPKSVTCWGKSPGVSPSVDFIHSLLRPGSAQDPPVSRKSSSSVAPGYTVHSPSTRSCASPKMSSRR